MAWKCLQSGACCRLPATLVMKPAEFAELLVARPDVTVTARERSDGFIEMQAGPCPFLGGDDRCTVYAVRPMNCRRYMCGRDSREEPVDLSPIPLRVLQNPALKKQYRINQQNHMRRYGHHHGWSVKDS